MRVWKIWGISGVNWHELWLWSFYFFHGEISWDIGLEFWFTFFRHFLVTQEKICNVLWQFGKLEKAPGSIDTSFDFRYYFSWCYSAEYRAGSLVSFFIHYSVMHEKNFNILWHLRKFEVPAELIDTSFDVGAVIFSWWYSVNYRAF